MELLAAQRGGGATSAGLRRRFREDGLEEEDLGSERVWKGAPLVEFRKGEGLEEEKGRG